MDSKHFDYWCIFNTLRNECENEKRMFLSNFWDYWTVLDMEKDFNKNTWWKMSKKMTYEYNKKEILDKQCQQRKANTIQCNCGGSYHNIESKRTRHFSTTQHKQYVLNNKN